MQDSVSEIQSAAGERQKSSTHLFGALTDES